MYSNAHVSIILPSPALSDRTRSLYSLFCCSPLHVSFQFYQLTKFKPTNILTLNRLKTGIMGKCRQRECAGNSIIVLMLQSIWNPSFPAFLLSSGGLSTLDCSSLVDDCVRHLSSSRHPKSKLSTPKPCKQTPTDYPGVPELQSPEPRAQNSYPNFLILSALPGIRGFARLNFSWLTIAYFNMWTHRLKIIADR